jgi:hypothetical protein
MNGKLASSVFHKLSHEPNHLSFTSVHPLHLKRNILYTLIIQATKYCSSFDMYVNEREKICMSLLLNKYPNKFIDEQFNRVLFKFNNNEPLHRDNYYTLHKNMLFNLVEKKKKPIDYYNNMFIHFTYCSNMKAFPEKFRTLWQKYFHQSPINEINPVLSTRNLDNLQKQLVKNNKCIIKK